MMLWLAPGIIPLGISCVSLVPTSTSHLERRLSFFGHQTSLKLFSDLDLKRATLPKYNRLSLGVSAKLNNKDVTGF